MKRQVRIFDTIDGKSSSRVLILLLELRYDRVVNIFFLLAEEVRTNWVKCVTTEFILSD